MAQPQAARPAGKRQSGALYLLKHFENAFGRTNEQALECLAQAAALKGVATRAFDFCHDDLRVHNTVNQQFYPETAQ
jgi:hypothetical protein